MIALDGALGLARRGMRVHPCRPGEKAPLLEDWPSKASLDQRTIESWWRRWPTANVAVATGGTMRLLVVDVDPDGGGEASMGVLERDHGAIPATVETITPRGGRHLYLIVPPDRPMPGNSAGRVGAGIDTRGDGGYVLVPPSVTMEAYRWADDRAPWQRPLEPGPAWLVHLLDPPAPPRSAWQPPKRMRGHAYALAALTGALERVAYAPTGQRNDTPNASAHSLFGLVATGDLHRDIVARGLEQAAVHAGLIRREIGATIRSAARAQGVPL